MSPHREPSSDLQDYPGSACRERPHLTPKDRNATTTVTSHQEQPRALSIVPTALRCKSCANKNVRSQVFRGVDNPAGSTTDTERSQRRNSERGAPGVWDSKAPEAPIVHSTGARARGCAVAVPRARRDPSRLPAVRLSPPAPFPHSGLAICRAGETPAAGPASTELTPTASRRRPTAPEGRRPRARHVSDGASRRASTLLWRPPPPPHLPGKGRWPRAPNRPHSLHGTNYRALSDRLAAPASPFRLGARAHRPRPPGARAGARSTLGAGVFQPFPRGRGSRYSPAGGWLRSRLQSLPHPGSLRAGPFPIPAAPFQELRRSMNVRSALIILFFTPTVLLTLFANTNKSQLPLLLLPDWLECPHSTLPGLLK